MSDYGIWNVLSVFIAVIAFVATYLFNRRNERADFLLERVRTLAADLAKAAVEIKEKANRIEELTEENIILMRRIARMENGSAKIK